jgi:hypothetical protein
MRIDGTSVRAADDVRQTSFLMAKSKGYHMFVMGRIIIMENRGEELEVVVEGCEQRSQPEFAVFPRVDSAAFYGNLSWR